MKASDAYNELVEKARRGCQASTEQLAKQTRQRLVQFLYREIMQEELVQEIVQRTMLDMNKILKKISRVELFWSWILKASIWRKREIMRENRRRPTVDLPEDLIGQTDELNIQIAHEFQQIVKASMIDLKEEYRQVLNLRCYENLEFSTIAELMDRKEFNVRVMFYRALKTLKKQLSRRGLDGVSVLAALILFGKLTARSKAAVTHVSVTAGTIKAGTTAAAVAGLSTGAVIAATVAVVTLAAIAAVWIPRMIPGETGNSSGNQNMNIASPWTDSRAQQDSLQECWYLWPQEYQESIFSIYRARTENGRIYTQWLLNERGSQFYDLYNNTVYLLNHHRWQPDFSITRLPTDSAKFTQTLNRIEGHQSMFHQVRNLDPGMWAVIKENNQF